MCGIPPMVCFVIGVILMLPMTIMAITFLVTSFQKNVGRTGHVGILIPLALFSIGRALILPQIAIWQGDKKNSNSPTLAPVVEKGEK